MAVRWVRSEPRPDSRRAAAHRLMRGPRRTSATAVTRIAWRNPERRPALRMANVKNGYEGLVRPSVIVAMMTANAMSTQTMREARLEALGQWMAQAQARMMRFEVDTANAAVAKSVEPYGYREEGRLEDFYADGVHQLLYFWRPGR